MLKYRGVSLIKNRRVPQWQAEQAEPGMAGHLLILAIFFAIVAPVLI